MNYLVFIPYTLIALGIVLGFLRVCPAMIAWGVCAIGVLVGIAIAVTLLVSSGFGSFAPALISAIPAIIAVCMVVKDLSYPRLNDVTTDVENPPQFNKAQEAAPNLGRNMTFPERFGPIIRTGYPDLKPLIIDQTPEQAFKQLNNLALDQAGWVITNHDAMEGMLEGEATTSVLGFIDDFVIRVTDQNGKACIDMRSKSREGLVDAGKNANRIRSFFDQVLNRL
ncbi:MAG: DUF1499 domain-containing protein [Pseudomonadota bacterium]